MTDDRLVTGARKDGDATEASLRPTSLTDFIGQEQARSNLRVFIQAARDRGIEVVMVDRPGGQPPADAGDVAACLTLIRRHLDAR